MENIEPKLFVFLLATFLGLEVIRRVSPLLHTPSPHTGAGTHVPPSQTWPLAQQCQRPTPSKQEFPWQRHSPLSQTQPSPKSGIVEHGQSLPQYPAH